MINGKMRNKLSFPMDTDKAAIEKAVLEDPKVAKWLEGKAPKENYCSTEEDCKRGGLINRYFLVMRLLQVIALLVFTFLLNFE